MKKTGKIISVDRRGGVAKATGKPFTIHIVKLEDGTEVEVGFNQPYSVGEYFDRTVEMKFGKLADVGPAKPGDSEVSSPSPRAAAGGAPSAPSGGRTFPVGLESPEMSIIRQNALTNAREAVMGMYDPNTISFNRLTKEERQQALDSVAEDILYLAYKFTDFSSGQREAKQAREASRMSPPSV